MLTALLSIVEESFAEFNGFNLWGGFLDLDPKLSSYRGFSANKSYPMPDAAKLTLFELFPLPFPDPSLVVDETAVDFLLFSSVEIPFF